MQYLILMKNWSDEATYFFEEDNHSIGYFASRVAEKVAYPEGRGGRFALHPENADTNLQELLIFAVSDSVTVDLEAIRQDYFDSEAENRKAETERRERAEYERLKAKFGDTE